MYLMVPETLSSLLFPTVSAWVRSFCRRRQGEILCHIPQRFGHRETVRNARAEDDAVSLVAAWMSGWLNVSVVSSSGSDITADMRLLIHCRGVLLYDEDWDGSVKGIRFDKAELPSGTLHPLLTDRNNIPVIERLVFNLNPSDLAQLSLQNNKDNYARRDRVV
jgi:hypothetical protein